MSWLALALAVAPVPPPLPTDRHGDALPPGVVVRFGTTRLRAADGALHFTPDGAALVAVGSSSARVFDRATGRLVWTLDPGPGLITASALSPDGRTLYTLHGRRIMATDLDVGRSVVFRDGEVYVAHHAQLAVSADGKVLAVSDPDNQATRPDHRRKGYVRLVDTATRRDVYYSDRFRIDGRALSLSPDGSVFTLGLYEGFVVYDVKAGREAFRLEKVPSLYTRPAFSPDGRLLAMFGPRWESPRLEVRDARTGKVLATPDQKFANAPSLRFSPDGSEVWCFAPDAPPVALDAAGKKPARPLVPGLQKEWAGHTVSADGKWLARWTGSVVRVWDVAAGREATPAPDNDTWRWAAPSPDGSRVATLGFDALAVWDAKTGRPVARVAGEGFGPDLRWTADGKQVTAGRGTAIGWWDAETGRPARELKVGGQAPMAVTVRGGRALAVFWKYENGYEAFAWDLRTGKETDWGGPDPHATEWEDYISPDGQSWVGLTDGVDGRGVRYVLDGPAGRTQLAFWDEYNQFAFAPDGKTVVGAGPAGVRVWDAATGKVVGPLPAPPPDEPLFRGHAVRVAVAPGGTAAVVISEQVEYRQPGGEVDTILTGRVLLRLYDLRTGRLWKAVGRFDTLDRVAFLPDGKLLVVRHGYAEVIDPEAIPKP